MEEKLTKKEKRALAKEEKMKTREQEEKTSKVRKFGIWVVVLFILGLGGYKFWNYINTPTSPSNGETMEVASDEWVKGNPEAGVTMIEYGDFQCPACASYSPLVTQLSQEFSEDLRIVYRQFPLVGIHKNAYDAARAAEAAGNQGKFWEMHDLLYEGQEEWSDLGNVKDRFYEYAKELGLDEEKFMSDFESDEVKDRIDADITSGNQLGVNSTPSFYLNGVRVQPRSYSQFKSFVERAL